MGIVLAVGNPHVLGQKPLTFNRQVGALLTINISLQPSAEQVT